MSWLVQPRLVNGPFEDPGVYLDFRYGRRAILFDLPDLSPLSSRELIRVSHVFVSHTHLDHFAGFDRLLRVCLHRPGPLTLVGPSGFVGQVEHRLLSVTWNLLGEESADFRLIVSEFVGTRLARTAEFRARDAFKRRDVPPPEMPDGLVLLEDTFRVEASTLDHGIPSLAFALRENVRVNVRRGALEAMGLPVGPWLNEAKRAVRVGLSNDTRIHVPGIGSVPLEQLRREALHSGPGQVVAYVTDAAGHELNADQIVRLANGADQLFIEAVFLDRDMHLAQKTRHLTAGQAGRLARRAGAKHITPFHFSARYLPCPDVLELEARHEFDGTAEVNGSTLQIGGDYPSIQRSATE